MGEEYEVVISGVGGKFPEADQIDELKEKLMNKCNLVTVDDRRWQQGVNGTPPALGKARDVEKFDSAFFGIHHRLSNFMDPQNRHILERSFEAIIDSGYNPNSLKGGNIGVYIATSLNETEYFLITQKIHDGFGPSQTVHSGWECGIEVLTLAAKQIRDGQIEAALIGVPNLHMFSQVAMNSATMGFLTFEKNAKPFDVNANGYIQSEAVVILFLQRKQDARRIYATVVHSNTCPFGLRNAPFTHCPEQPIVSFLKEFYLECQVDPKSVNFVEADGCAIKENDLTELKALSQVIGKDETSSLLVGSVKGNVGHTEAAASLVGVVKAIIALDSGIIPSTIMFKVPHLQMPEKIKCKIGDQDKMWTPYIVCTNCSVYLRGWVKGTQKRRLCHLVHQWFWLESKDHIVSENVPLVGDLVAVNSLSFTGGLGHALLKQNPKEKFTSSNSNNIIPRLLLVSARNAAGAEKIIQKVSNMPLDYEFVSLVNDVHLSEIPGHLYRTYVVHSGNVGKTISEFAETKSKKSQVWFVFSGMGSQWPGMGRGLLNLKVFADSIAKCDKVLAPRGIDIYKILTDDNPNAFDNILNCFVGIACMQVALVDLLYSIGIKPDGIIGHSVGEFGCAYADGCFTAEQMVLASYARGQASLDTKLIHGTMAAVGIGYRNIKDRLPPGIEVACHNSSESCTISGPTNDVKTFVDKLSQEGIFARLVNSGNIAYHSQYISPAGPKLLSYMKKVVPESKPRSPRWISSSVPYNEWNKPMAQYSSPEYHTNNLLSPVLFEEACKHIPIDAICIEIAPHGLLQAIIRRSLKNCIHIPLTLRNSTCSITYLLSAIGKLYLNNLHPDVNAIFPKVEYPVSRETPSLASLVTWDHSENWTYGEKYRNIKYGNTVYLLVDARSFIMFSSIVHSSYDMGVLGNL
ncbi:fatty acid synthase-like [Lycorma delicatula]|uniref:fatty acid synthase-like n=1 Tax=Lycorma delicatula TaxID=130591 RepID=UPI003F513EF1